jgi:hypothetical protein
MRPYLLFFGNEKSAAALTARDSPPEINRIGQRVGDTEGNNPAQHPGRAF